MGMNQHLEHSQPVLQIRLLPRKIKRTPYFLAGTYLCCVFKPYRAKAFARLPPIHEFHLSEAKEYTVPLVVRNPTVGEQEPHGIYSPTVGSERKTVRLFLKLTTGFQWMGVFTRSEKRPIRTLLLYYS